MNGRKVVLLTFFWNGKYGSSKVRIGAILGNVCGIQGQNYAAVLQGSKMTAGFQYRDWNLEAACLVKGDEHLLVA